jgi:hypothetical protein
VDDHYQQARAACWFSAGVLFRGSVDESGETGNLSCSGIFMNHTLFGCFVDGRFRGIQYADSIFDVGICSLSNILGGTFYAGFGCLVSHPPDFILASTF